MDETTQVAAPSNKKWIWIGLGILVLIGLALIGFRGSGIGSAYFAPGADVDRNLDGSTTYSNNDGSVTVGSGASMPANWPSDAPTAYSGATILYSGATNPTTGESGSAVAYTTSASVASVVEYYDARLKAEGWTIVSSAQAAGAHVISATKDTRAIGVYIMADGQGTTSVTAGVQL